MTPRTDLPTVLLSIETATRELDSKLVVAAAFAGLGCRAIVGHKEIVGAIGRASKNVVWLGKSIFADHTDDQVADRLIENRSAIMFLQDEGGVFPARSWTDLFLFKHHVERMVQRDVARICLWGERQKSVLGDHSPKLQNASTVTGSPRFDLCTPSFAWLTEAESGNGPASLGPYILVCSRFSKSVHAEGPGRPFQLRLDARARPTGFDMRSLSDQWFEQWRQDMHDFADFVVLVKEIAAALPRYTVVIRPHPSEDLAFFQQAFAIFPNVVVRRDGGVLAWIRTAALVVHSNCTTGIEAVLAGRPVLNYMPARGDRSQIDIVVAREAGTTVATVPEALMQSERLLFGGGAPPVWSEEALSTLNNLKADAIPLLLCETVAVLKERKIDGSKVVLPRARPVRGGVRRMLGRSSDGYIASKRGRLSADHVEAVIDGCAAHGFGKARIRERTDGFAVVEPQ